MKAKVLLSLILLCGCLAAPRARASGDDCGETLTS